MDAKTPLPSWMDSAATKNPRQASACNLPGTEVLRKRVNDSPYHFPFCKSASYSASALGGHTRGKFNQLLCERFLPDLTLAWLVAGPGNVARGTASGRGAPITFSVGAPFTFWKSTTSPL